MYQFKTIALYLLFNHANFYTLVVILTPSVGKGIPLSQLATTNVAGYVPLEGTPKVEVKSSHRRRKSKMSYDPSTLPPQVPDSHRAHGTKTEKAKRKSSRRAGSDVNQVLTEMAQPMAGKLTPNTLFEHNSPTSPNALRRKKHSVGTVRELFTYEFFKI